MKEGNKTLLSSRLSANASVIMTAAAAMIVGVVLGFFGGCYTYRIYPQVHAAKAAQQEQAELNREVRAGAVVSIGANEVIIKVSKGAADVGKTLALRETPSTTVQVGSAPLNRLGTMTDLTRYYKAGDAVDVLTRDDVTLAAIYRPLRPGEQVAQVVQQVPSMSSASGAMSPAPGRTTASLPVPATTP
jgi:hypothetical protein